MPSYAQSAAPLTPVTPAASHALPAPDVALPTGRPWHQRFNRWSRRLQPRPARHHRNSNGEYRSEHGLASFAG